MDSIHYIIPYLAPSFIQLGWVVPSQSHCDLYRQFLSFDAFMVVILLLKREFMINGFRFSLHFGVILHAICMKCDFCMKISFLCVMCIFPLVFSLILLIPPAHPHPERSFQLKYLPMYFFMQRKSGNILKMFINVSAT